MYGPETCIGAGASTQIQRGRRDSLCVRQQLRSDEPQRSPDGSSPGEALARRLPRWGPPVAKARVGLGTARIVRALSSATMRFFLGTPAAAEFQAARTRGTISRAPRDAATALNPRNEIPTAPLAWHRDGLGGGRCARQYRVSTVPACPSSACRATFSRVRRICRCRRVHKVVRARASPDGVLGISPEEKHVAHGNAENDPRASSRSAETTTPLHPGQLNPRGRPQTPPSALSRRSTWTAVTGLPGFQTSGSRPSWSPASAAPETSRVNGGGLVRAERGAALEERAGRPGAVRVQGHTRRVVARPRAR